MNEKIIIRKSKPNYFSFGAALILFYYCYNYISQGNIGLGIIPLTVGIIGLVHNILLITTPLLSHDEDTLIVKPKIPFEKKILLIEEIKDFKANSDAMLIIITKAGVKIKLDMGGFKKKEIETAKKYLKELLL